MYFWGFFGSIWAHEGPYRPVWARTGPARAREEREKFRRNAPFFLRNTFFSKIVAFDLHITFLYGFNVFFRFLAEIRFRTMIKSPQKASSRPKTC